MPSFYIMHSQLFILLVILSVQQTLFPWCSNYSASAQVLHEGCLPECAGVKIPYPFGTTPDCYLNRDFLVNCTVNATSGSPLLLLRRSSTIQVINLSYEGQLTVLTTVGRDCYFRNGTRDRARSTSRSITTSRFPFSNTQNKFVAVGCDTTASLASNDVVLGCTSRCGNETLRDLVYDGSCSGLGCCQTTIPKNLFKINITVRSFSNHSDIWDYNPCSYTLLVANDNFTFSNGDLWDFRGRTRVPVIRDWGVGKETCQDAMKNLTSYACRKNSHCIDVTNGVGYRCNCSQGYQGNPYMPEGCQDIDECTTIKPCGENKCTNSDGSFTCSCKDGYKGTVNNVNGGGCDRTQPIPIMQITVGVIVGFAAFLMVASWLFWGYNKRKHLQRKQRIFEQNGGLMLKQELSKKDGYSGSARIFSTKELKAATNNFDESRIIGKGGFGTVYKGILEDESVIAIKKSKVMDQNQIEQFINEVIVLSQINHRNVVSLLGCCLETEVPLLVYEYVSNGTLHEHIHENKNSSEVLSWDTRLRIATEVAGVLAYLHLEASVSIIHRDIKCTNILLDDNKTAKVSDFGASRLVPIDQDMLSTMVQGTIGYLDPEYLLTSQLTEKSDVYSFGVVLIELMTGKTALDFDRPEMDRCLASLFIISMKTDKLFSIIEDGLANDNNKTQIEEVAKLALACIRVIGDDRPSMRQVASELQKLHSVEKHPWNENTSIPKESDHLIGFKLEENQYDTINSHTTLDYDDSIRDNVVLLVGGGR